MQWANRKSSAKPSLLNIAVSVRRSTKLVPTHLLTSKRRGLSIKKIVILLDCKRYLTGAVVNRDASRFAHEFVMGGLVNAIMVTASRLGYMKPRLRSPLVIPCPVVTVGNQSATTWTFNSLTKAKNRLTRGKPTKCCALLGYTIGGGTVMIPSYFCCNMKTTHVTKRYGLNSGHPTAQARYGEGNSHLLSPQDWKVLFLKTRFSQSF